MASLMHRETRQIPSLVSAQLRDHSATYRDAARRMADFDPALVVTMARGSSDNAALYFKYLFELIAGIPVASVGPSVASVYGRSMRLDRAACLSISQSGRSPDLVAFQAMARAQKALNLALVNTLDSPLAEGAECLLPVASGEEKAVAATKSFVLSLTALAALTGHFAGDDRLLSALDALPAALDEALGCDWQPLVEALEPGQSLYVIGRGPGLAIAQEAALKFKEACEVHAESYSSAEVLHGPIQLAAGRLAALVFLTRDAARQGLIDAVARMADTGMKVFVADPAAERPVDRPGITYLPCAPAPDAMLDGISQITTFYVFAERYAAHLNLDPDQPKLLRKVTETV